MLLGSLSEMLTVAASVPFLSLITNPEKFIINDFFRNIFDLFNINSQKFSILFVVILFALLAIITTTIRLINIFLSTRFSARIGSDLSCKLYETTLKQNYEFHLVNNSSSSISLNTRFIGTIVAVINQGLLFISSFRRFANNTK